ncbi:MULTISPECIES: AarF/UbiB family protein [Methylobacterium]|nr:MULTISPECIES: AarF/UbiB family protein [Methylobacterium]MBN4093292.1 ABC transporter [Methylobacterium sp. OT2]UIN34314.1 AarF/UbiB family protein [Methylobacterium oryzae]SEG15109.1 ubiquinone biosynthesis protein [Methylobacterium sp. 190mf]SEH57805.1 ubiquinone biosynthesis protein [Methylobacterium sp. 275MFSha3.1]SEO05998.1 ubiquinone biosynthesis protein [Methylobacterium sp. UNC300MFChir4.1]
MLKTAFVAARDRQRLSEIATILIGFGVTRVVDRLGLRYLPLLPRRQPRVDVTRLSEPERLRRAIEALGPTFIKFGQVLASRPDLLSPAWTEELQKLHSQVVPVTWEQIGPQLELDLGASPMEVFAEFDTNPIASASIAQVYRARLHSGEDVIVKVLRPNLRKIIEADLRLMAHGARIVENEWPDMARYQPREQMRHLAEGLNGELDLLNEARNCELLAQIFEDRDDIVFPKIHWEYCSERVLVQDFIHGIPPNDEAALRAAGIDKKLLAQKGTDAFLQMALIEGVFHADPHPGNMLALPGNKIGFIDFGIIGRLSQRRRSQLLVLIGAMLKQDADGLMAVLLDWTGTSNPDLTRLQVSAQSFVESHSSIPLNLGLVLTDFMNMARENDLAMPTDLAILFKGLVTADGVMRHLDPNFDLFAAAGPTVRASMQTQFSLSALKQKAEALGVGLYGAASELPTLIHLMLVRLKQGRVTVEIEVKGLDKVTRGIERAAARVAVALVVAAFATQLAPRLIDLGTPVFVSIGLIIFILGIGWLVLLMRNK